MSQSTPPPVINSKTAQSKSFGMPEVAAIVSVVMVLLAALVIVPSEFTVDTASEMMGRLIGAMLVSAVIALVVWLVTRRFKPKAWVWTFAGVMLAFGALTIIGAKGAADRRGHAALQNLRREMAAAKQGQPGAAGPADFDRVVRAADDLAASAGTKDKPIARLTADFVKYNSQIARGSHEAVQRFQKTGGINASTIKSKEDCDARIAAAGEYDLAARGQLDQARRIDAELDRLASLHGVSGVEVEQLKQGIHSSGQNERVVRVREIDVELAGVFSDYLTLLRDNWGKWRVEEGKVLFSVPGILPRFNGFVARVQELSAEQIKLMGELSTPAP